MGRPATFAVAALLGVLAAGCAGSLGQSGVSLPFTGDSLQTVSDAADSLDAHRGLASESAKSAIAVTDALGSYVREIGSEQRMLVGSHSARNPRTRGVVSHSALVVIRPAAGMVTEYCQSSAGYSATGIPSLDETFGWESGAYAGGSRTIDGRGSATWVANASGAVVRGAIGSLSVRRSASGATCPMMLPAYVVKGGASASAFVIPIAMTFHRGTLVNLSVPGARFSTGESLYVATTNGRRGASMSGTITNGRVRLGSFRTDASGNGTLTITSTGAQYVVADWIVAGT
jgi:hypothetical protein